MNFLFQRPNVRVNMLVNLIEVTSYKQTIFKGCTERVTTGSGPTVAK